MKLPAAVAGRSFDNVSMRDPRFFFFFLQTSNLLFTELFFFFSPSPKSLVTAVTSAGRQDGHFSAKHLHVHFATKFVSIYIYRYIKKLNKTTTVFFLYQSRPAQIWPDFRAPRKIALNEKNKNKDTNVFDGHTGVHVKCTYRSNRR